LQTQYLGKLRSSLEKNDDEGQEEKAG